MSGMGTRIRLIILLTLLAMVLAPASSNAQDESTRYFPETGHYVNGIFLEKFESVADPVQMFGFPITEEIIALDSSPVAGMRVQYFQRARFEYHPTELVGNQVQIAKLGSELLALENPGEPACFFLKIFLPAEHL